MKLGPVPPLIGVALIGSCWAVYSPGALPPRIWYFSWQLTSVLLTGLPPSSTSTFWCSPIVNVSVNGGSCVSSDQRRPQCSSITSTPYREVSSWSCWRWTCMPSVPAKVTSGERAL